MSQLQVMDSSKLIQHLLSLAGGITQIKDKLENHDEKLMTLISQNARISRYLEKLARGHGQKNKATKDTDTNWSHLMHLPTALQQNITMFTSDFSFEPTDFPDQLIAEGCLSESECENIRGKSSEADRVRLLIKKIKSRGPKAVQTFLDIIKEDKAYKHLVNAVNETHQKIIDEGKKKQMCGYCIVRKTVDLRDIADHLWEKQLINDELYGNIIEMEVPATMQYLWSHVVHFINNARNPSTAKLVLQEALEPKYPHLVQPLASHSTRLTSDQGRILICTCRSRRRLVEYQGSLCGSGNVPNMAMFESQHNSESENLTSLDSSDFTPSSIASTGISYSKYWEFDAEPDPKVNITIFEKPASPDTTTPECSILANTAEEKDRSRHSSGKFQHEDREQLESGQLGSLPFVNSEDLNDGFANTGISVNPDALGASGFTERPVFAKEGSSTDSNRKASDSNATITPEADAVKVLNLPLNKPSDAALLSSSSASPDKEKRRPKFYLSKVKPKRSKKYRCKPEGSSSGEEADDSDEEDHAYKRMRHKNQRSRRSRFLSRQTSSPNGYSSPKQSPKPDSTDDTPAVDSLPSGTILTMPRPVIDSTVGVRELMTGSKKSSKKRAERRKKFIAFQMTEDATPSSLARSGISRSMSLPQGSSGTGYAHSIPYNPTWAHRPQNWTKSQWDHNQARRFWKISQLQAASTSSLDFYSDSDLRTEESDAMAFTDDNTI